MYRNSLGHGKHVLVVVVTTINSKAAVQLIHIRTKQISLVVQIRNKSLTHILAIH